MLQLRSFVFNVVYYVNIILWMLVLVPSFLMPRMVFIRAARLWAHMNLWLLRVICGTRVEFRGTERLPPGGFLVACKHQSMWETFALFCILDDPAFVLKRELLYVPFFGWYALKARSIPVRRGGGASALRDMNALAREEARHGRQIVIFPEGTRTAAGAPPAYKYGIAHMYEQMGIECVPMALNSGVFWPRRKFLRYPGTIVVEVLEPIPAGLDRDQFFTTLQERIETASDALLAEARAEQRRRSTPNVNPN
jgi:1-acyl-sn-glycerol-3-phosphate acyltransferase